MIDLPALIHTELRAERREPDGLLHASTHLSGSLRHAQLDAAGAPKLPSSVISEITLKTGTLWHEWLHNKLRSKGVPYMAEVDVTPGMPEGWAGTLDALLWDEEIAAFRLYDFKTQRGVGMSFILADGAKDDHQRQTSLYYAAAQNMGLPLAAEISILYIPKDSPRAGSNVEPVVVSFEPIPARELNAEADERREKIMEYLDDVEYERSVTRGACSFPCPWITRSLAPEQERVQKLVYDPKTETWDVRLVPHWSAAYCEYPPALCNCAKQGSTKVGVWDVDGETYHARSGFEDVIPLVAP